MFPPFICVLSPFPRLCSLTITRLSLLTPLPADLSSLSLAVKMQSSKRTLRSHEIPVPLSALTVTACVSSTGTPIGSTTTTTSGSNYTQTATVSTNVMASLQSTTGGTGTGAAGSTTTTTASNNTPFGTGGIGITAAGSGGGGGVVVGSSGVTLGGHTTAPLLETDLDLHFSLQYPHFLKRDGNRWVCVWWNAILSI